MTTAMQSAKLEEEAYYSEESFEDDFESDQSSSRDLFLRKETAAHAGDPLPVSEANAFASKSQSSMSSKSTSLSSSRSSTPSARQSSHHSSAIHRGSHPALQAAAISTHDSSSSNVEYTSSSYLGSSSKALPEEESSSAHDTSASAEGGADEEELYPTNGDTSSLAADLQPDGQQRCADGSFEDSHARSSAASEDSKRRERERRSHADEQAEKKDVDLPSDEPAPVQRPEIPSNADELHSMQDENAFMREELFNRSRDQFHATATRHSKAAGGSTFDANRTVGGPAASQRTAGAPAAPVGMTQREATARLVKESLLVHRALQILRQEKRELTQRRDELRTLVCRYKKAMKYKDLVEEVKRNIVELTEDHRDAQLEVRCNEKLLLLNDNMSDTGFGERRLLEEIRAQNMLTQRRRDNTLRDADSEQRKHDAAAKRVEELKYELKRRREALKEGSDAEVSHLRALNQTKKEHIRELRTQLQQYAPADQARGDEVEGYPHSSTRRASPHRKVINQQEDAEREYLLKRIAEMQEELARIRAEPSTAPTGAAPAAGQGAGAYQAPSNEFSNSSETAEHPSHSVTSGSPRIGDAGVAEGGAVDAPPPPPFAVSPPNDAAPWQEPPRAPKAVSEPNGKSDVAEWLTDFPTESTLQQGAAPAESDAHADDGMTPSYPVETASSKAYASQQPWQQEESSAPAAAEPATDSPAWLNGGAGETSLESSPAAGAFGAAPSPSPHHAAAAAEESGSEYAREEELEEHGSEGLEEEEEEEEEEEPEYMQDEEKDEEDIFGFEDTSTTHAAPTTATPANAEDDAGPDWLNF